ncbi:MAG: phosphodiester glycosidase family protein [bacterium]
MIKRLAILFLFPILVSAELTFTWEEVSMDLPPSIKVFEGINYNRPARAWYIDVDLSDTNIVIKPVMHEGSYCETVSAMVSRNNGYAGINGGFFYSGIALGLVQTDGIILCAPLATIVRSGVTYYPTRGAFGIKPDGTPDVTWAYMWQNAVYSYPEPNPNYQGNPAPPPNPALFTPNAEPWNTYQSIGGGPNLVSNGVVNVTYEEEIFWDSGVGLDNNDPRTAIGYTSGNHVIMFTVDGRQSNWSIGLNIPEVAETMISLGCVEAMGLDGGGSTTIIAADSLLNKPSDGNQRQVANALVIMPKPEPPPPGLIFDTGDSVYNEFGTGWFESSNAGYWGSTKARLNAVGSGSDYAVWQAVLPYSGLWQIDAWWVPASNRAIDTPFIISSGFVRDTLFVNQRIGANQWNEIGKWNFEGGDSVEVIVTDEAGGNASIYVCTDAIQLTLIDSVTTSVTEITPVHRFSDIIIGYPNPFNTSINFKMKNMDSRLERAAIYDLMGHQIIDLTERIDSSNGGSTLLWDGINSIGNVVSSGIYFIQLVNEEGAWVYKILMIR